MIPRDDEHGVNAYNKHPSSAAKLGKAPPVDDDNSIDLLEPKAAALHIARSTFDYYVSISRPYWDAGLPRA